MEMKNSNCENLSKRTLKKNISNDVKECLVSDKLSNFESLKLNINNYILNKSNKHGEIGRTLFDHKNLPARIDRVHTTFGQSKRDPCTCADVIHGEYINYPTDDVHVQTNLPGTQISRRYKSPFSKESLFGKATKANVQGNKAKKLIHFFEKDLISKNIQNNFQKKSHSHTFCTTTKNIQNSNPSNIEEILRQAPINKKIIELKKSIGHINALRLNLKKRDFSFEFINLYRHFRCLDQFDRSCTVSLDTFYHVLNKVNIKPDIKMFELLLKEFNFITEDSKVYYMEALSLLNWKCEFPSLLKIYDLPLELQFYRTTYQDSMKRHQ